MSDLADWLRLRKPRFRDPERAMKYVRTTSNSRRNSAQMYPAEMETLVSVLCHFSGVYAHNELHDRSRVWEVPAAHYGPYYGLQTFHLKEKSLDRRFVSYFRPREFRQLIEGRWLLSPQRAGVDLSANRVYHLFSPKNISPIKESHFLRSTRLNSSQEESSPGLSMRKE